MNCLICNTKDTKILKDFNLLPRSFDFQEKRNSQSALYRITQYQCKKCAVIQLKKTGKSDSFKSKYKWITNKEPDEHLIKLSKYIENFLRQGKKILFLSRYDQILFDCARKKYGKKVYLLNNRTDLNIRDKNASQFFIQDQLIKKNLKKLKKKIGTFDLIVSCRVLEHSYNIFKLIKNLKNLLNYNGQFIFEVPDSYKSLKQGDIGMIWEEHPVYFTQNSIKLGFQKLGFNVAKMFSYNYPQENALAFHLIPQKKVKINKKIFFTELKLGNNFVKKLKKIKKKIINNISKYSKEGSSVVLFGAGHRSIIFINALNISKYFSHIIDDNKKKIGLYFPSTNLKIKSSTSLSDKKIKLCLLSLNIKIEKKIVKKLKKLNGNVVFFSTSPDSKMALTAYHN